MLFDSSFEGAQRLRPEPIEIRPQRLNRVRVDGVEATRSRSAVDNQVRVLQYAQMLRNRRPTDWKFAGEFPDRERAVVSEPSEDGPARRIAERVELYRMPMVSFHLR